MNTCSRCGFEYQHTGDCPRCVVDSSTFEVIESHDPILLRPVGVEQTTYDGTIVDHALFVGVNRVVCYTHGRECMFTDLRLRGSGFVEENSPR